MPGRPRSPCESHDHRISAFDQAEQSLRAKQRAEAPERGGLVLGMVKRQRRPDEIEGAEGLEVVVQIERPWLHTVGHSVSRGAILGTRQHDRRSIHGDDRCRPECRGERGRRHTRPAAKVGDPPNLSAVPTEQIGAQRDRLIGQAGRELALRLQRSRSSVIPKRGRVTVTVF